MKNYEVYQGYEAVKRGFCWPGFFFPFFWLLAARLWLYWAVFIIGVVAASYSAAILQEQGRLAPAILLNIAILGAFVTVGAYGNRWRVAALKRRGYALIRATTADRAAAAIADASGAHPTAK